MSIQRKISTACALALISITFSSTATACSPGQRKPDVKGQLPKEISNTIPPKIGVETIAEETLPSGTKLLGAILVPKWTFNSCDNDPLPANDYGIRSLVVWRFDGARWIEIGRNSEIAYPATEAGSADVSPSWEGDELVLRQSSVQPPRSDWNDQYFFVYDEELDTMTLTKHSAASHYYPMGGGGYGYNEYEKAKKIYGDDICDYDGFEGEINYLSGSASIEQCGFAKPKTRKSTNISDNSPTINSLKDESFEESRYFSSP